MLSPRVRTAVQPLPPSLPHHSLSLAGGSSQPGRHRQRQLQSGDWWRSGVFMMSVTHPRFSPPTATIAFPNSTNPFVHPLQSLPKLLFRPVDSRHSSSFKGSRGGLTAPTGWTSGAYRRPAQKLGTDRDDRYPLFDHLIIMPVELLLQPPILPSG